MQLLATLGESMGPPYVDRPTVKVVIWHDDKVLLLDDGLLPGGGVDEDESDTQAIARELAEELGAHVSGLSELGEVVQYRDFLRKRYVIRGYTAKLDDFHTLARPQDAGEAAFRLRWLSLHDARSVVDRSIENLEKLAVTDDRVQGKLYNLHTTSLLLSVL